MFLCAPLHLALCGRVSIVRGGFGGEDEESEKVGVMRKMGGRVRLYSPAYSRPVVHERSSPENSSCSAF